MTPAPARGSRARATAAPSAVPRLAELVIDARRATRALGTVAIPVATKSEANTRCHHMARARRVKTQRHVTALHLRSVGAVPVVRAARRELEAGGALVVCLARIGARDLDTDNLAGSMKAVRDAVAGELGIDDGARAVTWLYDQRRGPSAVEVTFVVHVGLKERTR